MNTRTANLITVIKDAASPAFAISGITPPPIPSYAFANSPNPWVTVQETHSKEEENLVELSGIRRSVMQVNCWSGDYEASGELREQIKFYLLSFKGSAGDSAIASVRHGSDHELFDGERQLYQAILILFVWWSD